MLAMVAFIGNTSNGFSLTCLQMKSVRIKANTANENSYQKAASKAIKYSSSCATSQISGTVTGICI